MNTDHLSETELREEISELQKRADSGSLSAADARRLAELRSALRTITKVKRGESLW